MANVLSPASENIYQSVSSTGSDGASSKDASTGKIEHTRIYEYLATTILLDEMSVPLTLNLDSDGTIDSSTGLHADTAGSNANENIFKTEGNMSPDRSVAIGVAYPLLRINDHYFTSNEITYFSLETVGFIPTIEVSLECQYNDMLKTNMIKDGDICSVFINPGHGTIKSYRGDFQITMARVPDMNQFFILHKVKIRFIGELYIPTIYDATQTFAFSGSSRDALIDAALKLGLGFFFSDPEDTNDVLMWYSMSDGEQKSEYGGDSPAISYIKDTALHAYKNFESFYDCWIDPRYAISFINIAQMLGGSGMDEEIDLAIFNSGFNKGKQVDGKNAELSSEEKANNPLPQPKILNNIGEDETSMTSFLVVSYSENNNNSITNRLGLSNSNFYSIKNTGIQNVEENSVEMNYSIPVNNDKLKNGFYIMAGPGLNLTYTSGDNGSFVNQHKSVQGGLIAETQSDTDAKDIAESGNNMYASGNTNKFYETADGHNTLCNSWLKKKTITVTLNGCNMQVMRGEKIPMILRDNFNPILKNILVNNEIDNAYSKILISCTGWFIIQDLKWIYDVSMPLKGTNWRTELTLTRREWPIPGYAKNAIENNTESQIIVENDIASGSTKEAIGEETQNQEQQDLENAKLESVTTEGLKPYLKTIYDDIVNACSKNGGKKILLISGRRWPVDENDNIVEEPIVQDGTLWKFKNTKGDIVWYSSKTSPHATGDAFDIINDKGTKFDDIVASIVSDNKTLYDMITNGVFIGTETSKDDTGNTVLHYHVGIVDKNNSDMSTSRQNWWEKVVKHFKDTISYNGQNISVSQYLTYCNK